MKNYKTLIFSVIVIALFAFFAYLKGWILANFPSVDAQQAISMIDKNDSNLSIVDVRTPKEYKEGHLPRAIPIPLSDIKTNPPALQKLKGKKLLVYCRTGIRSVAASRYLESHGYTPINLSGGINAVKK